MSELNKVYILRQMAVYDYHEEYDTVYICASLRSLLIKTKELIEGFEDVKSISRHAQSDRQVLDFLDSIKPFLTVYYRRVHVYTPEETSFYVEEKEIIQ